MEDKYTVEELTLLKEMMSHGMLVFKKFYGGGQSILLFDVFVILSKCHKDNAWEGIFNYIDGLSATGSNEVRKVFYGTQEDLPLYINDKLEVVKTIVKWRLKIGK